MASQLHDYTKHTWTSHCQQGSCRAGHCSEVVSQQQGAQRLHVRGGPLSPLLRRMMLKPSVPCPCGGLPGVTLLVPNPSPDCRHCWKPRRGCLKAGRETDEVPLARLRPTPAPAHSPCFFSSSNNRNRIKPANTVTSKELLRPPSLPELLGKQLRGAGGQNPRLGSGSDRRTEQSHTPQGPWRCGGEPCPLLVTGETAPCAVPAWALPECPVGSGAAAATP